MTLNAQQTARLFKTLCDENRVQIVRLLVNGEMCACQLLDLLQIGQPTLSHHMKILCEGGIVRARKEGKWMHYSLCPEGVQKMHAFLNGLAQQKQAAKCSRCKK